MFGVGVAAGQCVYASVTARPIISGVTVEAAELRQRVYVHIYSQVATHHVGDVTCWFVSRLFFLF